MVRFSLDCLEPAQLYALEQSVEWRSGLAVRQSGAFAQMSVRGQRSGVLQEMALSFLGAIFRVASSALGIDLCSLVIRENQFGVESQIGLVIKSGEL